MLLKIQLMFFSFLIEQVPATFPVLAAAHKALLAQSRNSLATRTLHSELIYNYSGSKHVSFHQQWIRVSFQIVMFQ